MAGPWEKYQTQETQGPWTRYAPTGDINHPAGLPAGVNLPGVPAHPEVSVKEPPKGFIQGLADSSGASGAFQSIIHPIDTAMAIPGGILGEGSRVKSQLKEAWNTPNNQPIKAIDRTLYATPFIGSSLKEADDQAKAGNYKGAAGTSLGTLASIIAPAALHEGIVQALPSTERAGKLLSEVSTAARDKPVNFVRTRPLLEDAQRLTTYGHGNITPLNSLFDRMNTINPIDFEEARGRYSPLTRLTSVDRMSATPQLQSAAKSVARAMRADIGDVAESVGKRQQYERGMREYGNAMRNKEMANKISKHAGKGAATAIGGGALYGLYNTLKD